MPAASSRAFATARDLEKWLRANHAKERELWVRIFKKDSGTSSVTWQDCVVVCLAWGWIDGTKRSLDEHSFLQRLTPRRPKSGWSKKNREHAERLIAEGKVQPAGLVHVEAARADGRWEQVYAGSADMELPDDFLRALDKHPVAKVFFATLKRAQAFSIYHHLQTAKRPETRGRRRAPRSPWSLAPGASSSRSRRRCRPRSTRPTPSCATTSRRWPDATPRPPSTTRPSAIDAFEDDHFKGNVVDLSAVMAGKKNAEELQKTAPNREELADYNPAHAFYIYAQNQTSVVAAPARPGPHAGKAGVTRRY